MSINIERLKRDRAYWDAVAPEEATHFCPETEEEWPAWWINPRNKTGAYMAKRADIQHDAWSGDSFNDHTQAHAISRPEPATEWDGDNPDRSAPEWRDWKIVPGSWPYWMLQRMNYETGAMSYDNPVKGMIRDLWSQVSRPKVQSEQDAIQREVYAKAERDREDLIALITDGGYLHDSGSEAHRIANSILAAGWQKPD